MSARKGIAKHKQKEIRKRVSDEKREKRILIFFKVFFISIQLSACAISNVIISKLAVPINSTNREIVTNKEFEWLAILIFSGFMVVLPLNHKMSEKVSTKEILCDAAKGIEYYVMAAIVGVLSAAFLNPHDKLFWSNVVVYVSYIAFYFLIFLYVLGIVAAGNKVAEKLRKYKIKPLVAEMFIELITGGIFIEILYLFLNSH